MNTSNQSSKRIFRPFQLTRAGSRLARYLEYVESRPAPEQPEDPTEAVKRWIIAHRDTVSMDAANAYIRAAKQDWGQAVRWIFEYIVHDKLMRQDLYPSVYTRTDWNAITAWITYQTDESLAALAVPEQHDLDREQAGTPSPKWGDYSDDNRQSDDSFDYQDDDDDYGEHSPEED